MANANRRYKEPIRRKRETRRDDRYRNRSYRSRAQTRRLNRLPHSSQPKLPSRGRLVGGKLPLFRFVGGPLAIFLTPDMVANGSMGMADVAYWLNRDADRVMRSFQKLELESGTYHLPTLSSKTDTIRMLNAYERGDWQPAPLPSFVAEPAPILAPQPNGVGWVQGNDLNDLLSAISLFSQKRYRNSLKAIAEISARGHRRYTAAVKESQFQTKQNLVNLRTYAQILAELRSGLVIPGSPHPSAYWKFGYDPSTGEIGHYFDSVGYSAAVQAWEASNAAKNALIEAQAKQEFLKEQAKVDAYNKEVYAHNQKVANAIRLQGLVIQNNTAFDFVLSKQPQLKLNYNTNKTRKRKNDRKTDKSYGAALALINNTWGRYDEAQDLAAAFMDNLDPVDTAREGLWETVTYSGVTDVAPVNFRAAVELYATGEAELDWLGFFLDVVANQTEDYIYGQIGKSSKKLSELTKRPVGITSGPAL